ncbi:hypothetical protein B7463_g5820, partial [Scytalidium lignicola]
MASKILLVQSCTMMLFTFLCYTSHCAVFAPKPPGRYAVSMTAMKLIDSTRIDPYQPNNQSRAIMVSSFYPVSHNCKSNSLCPVPYMPSFTAAFLDQSYSQYGIPNGTFEQFQLQLACNNTIDPKDNSFSVHSFPIVLFSPGAGAPRLFYSIIAQYISSNGFIVITIDHPGDAELVEFSSGTVIYNAITNLTLNDLTKSVVVRSQDASFVLDSLSQVSIVRRLIPGACSGFDVPRVAMYGHSLGGAAAASAAYHDHRIVGAVDLDGSLFGSVVSDGLPKDSFFLL